jgi:hypothetical protein
VIEKKPNGVLFCLLLVLISGCAAEKPEPPRAICDVEIPASAVTPLLPREGGKVFVERFESIVAPNACSVYVEDRLYFSVLHDPERPNFSFPPNNYSPAQPSGFKGRLGLDSLDAMAIAYCQGGKPPVFGKVTLSLDESEGLYSNSRDDLEKFMNAYMPALQKHYGCKD